MCPRECVVIWRHLSVPLPWVVIPLCPTRFVCENAYFGVWWLVSDEFARLIKTLSFLLSNMLVVFQFLGFISPPRGWQLYWWFYLESWGKFCVGRSKKWIVLWAVRSWFCFFANLHSFSQIWSLEATTKRNLTGILCQCTPSHWISNFVGSSYLCGLGSLGILCWTCQRW